ncbi:hypothetical protein [Nocardia carnea]|uniref:hypothetical protein n=1 Tax=Nocardia carnea TaxID=37328 RepID=UPI002454AF44|nr:hypothetical protein [Nocardia carnea]
MELDYDRVSDLDHTNPTQRHGALVTHPAQPWTSTVHAFLRHLEAEGFDAAPRVAGSGFDAAGDETLTWLEGTICPVDPIDEVAATAFYCAQLFDDDVAEQIGLPDAAIRAQWFAAFLDGYGLPRRQRADLVDRILRFVIKDNGWYARVQGFTQQHTHTEALWTPAWQSRAALWTLEHRDILTTQLPVEPCDAPEQHRANSSLAETTLAHPADRTRQP